MEASDSESVAVSDAMAEVILNELISRWSIGASIELIKMTAIG